MRSLTAATVFILAAALGVPVFAQPAGGQPLAPVEEAYRQAERYQATLDFRVEQERGRWTSTQAGDFYIAYDRENGRLKIDQPELYVVVKDGKLYARTGQIPGRHIETDAPDPLTYDALIQTLTIQGQPMLANPPMIDLAFLLSDDPVQSLTGGGGGAGAVEPAEDGSPRYAINMGQGDLVLTADADTRLITRARLAMGDAAGGNALTLSYDYEIDQPSALGEEVFAFDTEGSEAVASGDELIDAAAAGAGGAEQGGQAMQGQDAPEFQVETTGGEAWTLADAGADVVVLDFWATWCGPCRRGLPELQQVHEWAEQSGKSVAIYAVNTWESQDRNEALSKAQQFWQEQGFTIPVLMDYDGSAAQAFGVQGIPQTVILADGKIRNVHQGVPPSEEAVQQLDQTIRSEIEALLAEGEG